MTKANRVLSPPATNTPPTLESNPPPENPAESVDFLQPAIGQTESPKLTGESGKPTEGLSAVYCLAPSPRSL